MADIISLRKYKKQIEKRIDEEIEREIEEAEAIANYEFHKKRMRGPWTFEDQKVYVARILAELQKNKSHTK